MDNTQTPPTPPPNVRVQYQPPEGAIPIARIKRVAIGIGILVLAYLTLWGSCHRSSPVPAEQKKTSGIFSTTPANIDSQEAELQREIDEANRLKQQADFAKQRQQHMEEAGPQQPQADPVQQLRKQLLLEDIRRAHVAPYASTVAFAPQAGASEQGREGVVHNPTTSPAIPAAQADPPAAAETVPPAPGSRAPEGTYRLDEGTVIETVLLNRLDGEFAGPVITQVSTDAYSRGGLHLLIPRGSRFLGEARNVQSFDERRLAILFHKAILPNSREISLDKFQGLDQIGETGVVSKVNRHYFEIFGTSLALGAIGGLAQIGNAGGPGYDPAVGFRVGVTERMNTSAEQVLSKFLNKLPTITVREGSRIKVILTSDLNVEEYE